MFVKEKAFYHFDETEGMTKFTVKDLLIRKIKDFYFKLVYIEIEGDQEGMGEWYPVHRDSMDEEYIIIHGQGERHFLYADYVS